MSVHSLSCSGQRSLTSWLGYRAWRGVALLCLALLASCATLNGPREVDIPLARLQTSLDQRFPIEQRLFEVIRIGLREPRLTSLPAEQRLRITLTSELASPMMKQPWQGQLSFSGRLAINAAHDAILLEEVRVEQIDSAGLDPMRERLLTQVATLAAESFLSGSTLYRFQPADLKQLGTQYRPTLIEPSATGLRLRFEPLPERATQPAARP